MIAYATVGVNDLAASAAFYDAVMEAWGAPAWGLRDHGPTLYLAYPRDPVGDKISAVCTAPD